MFVWVYTYTFVCVSGDRSRHIPPDGLLPLSSGGSQLMNLNLLGYPGLPTATYVPECELKRTLKAGGTWPSKCWLLREPVLVEAEARWQYCHYCCVEAHSNSRAGGLAGSVHSDRHSYFGFPYFFSKASTSTYPFSLWNDRSNKLSPFVTLHVSLSNTLFWNIKPRILLVVPPESAVINVTLTQCLWPFFLDKFLGSDSNCKYYLVELEEQLN